FFRRRLFAFFFGWFSVVGAKPGQAEHKARQRGDANPTAQSRFHVGFLSLRSGLMLDLMANDQQPREDLGAESASASRKGDFDMHGRLPCKRRGWGQNN